MKDTDKVTLTVGQIKKLIKESKQINEGFEEGSKLAEISKAILDYFMDNIWLPQSKLERYANDITQILADKFNIG